MKTITILEPGQKAEYKAVYRSRSDSDFDLVAVIALGGTFPMLSQADSDQEQAMVDTLAEAIKSEGDDALIIASGDADFPDVWDGTKEPKNITLCKANAIICDASTGHVWIVTGIEYPQGDMAEGVEQWCKSRRVRFNDCTWMQLQPDSQIKTVAA